MSRSKGSAQTRSSAPRTSSSRSPRSSPSAPRSPSTSSSAAAAQRRSPRASSSLPSQQRASQPAQLPITTASPPVSPYPQSSAASSTTPSRRWAEGRAAATADIEKSAAAAPSYFSPSSLGLMSPLARALQAQWRQLQQDLLSPSALHIDRSHHTTAEDDVLRVLRSIGKFAEEAVEDAAHTVPYLLAFAVTPLPTVATQVVALAALRGVLSSLPSVYGAAEACAFVEDVCLGEHQALQALSLCALVALEKTEEETSGPSSAAGASAARRSPSSLSAGKPRGGHRSLLSRSGDTRSSEDPLHALLQGPTRRAAGDGNGSSGGGKPHSTSFTAGASPQQDGMELQSRVAHLSLRLLDDVATLCPAVADALLSSDALLKRALRALTSCAHVTASDKAVWRVAGRRTTEDVLCVLLTLLKSEAAQQNEAALVLCSYDAPRAVAALAQTLAYRSYNACGAVRDVTAAEEAVPHASAEQLLWSALKVLGWLTRGCPAGLRGYLSEVTTTPSLLAQVLTVLVAEIREAAALWLAALLETQPAASLQLVQDLFSLTPPSAEPAASPMGALVEMLRWRGAQMHVYGVSAMVCWRWMLLSHPTRVAALLPQDSGLLATLMELIFRVAPSLQLAAERAGEDEKTSSLEGTMASLPLRLIALEAAHVLTLSFALGSLETRTRLVTHFMSGSLSPLTLQKLRDTASLLVLKTHPGYYDNFPAMEVKLAEPELSEAMQRAGATVSPTASPAADAPSAASALVPQRTRTSVVVRLSSGAQWRQLILESLAELTAGAEQSPSSVPAALVPRQHTPAASSIVSSPSNVKPGDVSSRSRNRSRQAGVAAVVMPRDGVLRASAQSAAGAVAPIRVLGLTAPQQQSSAALHSRMNDDAVVSDEEEEHRVDIGAIISASLAEGQGHAFSSPFLKGSTSREAAVPRVPRTVREATLLPTSLSTTALRYAVVQQAEGLGGLFVQDSMRTVLQLAQHYTSSHATAAAGGTSGVSAKLVQAVTADRRASRVRGSAKVSHIDASVLEAPAGQRARSPSAVFGSAPRFDPAPRKERNPFAPAVKATSAQRAWTVQELQREDVLLFLVRYTHLMTELPEAVAAVEDHLYYLRRQLQLCPTRDVRRRCVLNDLYMNVYPTIHLFLRFVDQQARRSRGVLQMLSSLSGGTLHSGNVLEAYDAVGQCTGLTVEL